MKKVLIVDDSAFMRMLLKEKLAKIGGMKLHEASNGRQAIEEFKKHRPDLVLLDIILPDIGGDVVLGELRKTRIKSNVIMVTAVGQKPMMERCERLGISGYITKPFDDKKIVELIGRVMKQPFWAMFTDEKEKIN